MATIPNTSRHMSSDSHKIDRKLDQENADKTIQDCCNLAGIYLLKVNYRNTRTRCEIYSKLTIKALERCHCYHSGVFIVNFEHVIVDWERYFTKY